MPKISIVTANYNNEKYIERSIKSVISQSFADFEYFIIDDCSTDNSMNIIESFSQKDSRIIFIKNKKKVGAGFSRNLGIIKSKGEYLTFLDSDDFWYENFLQESLNFSIKNNYDFVFSSFDWINESGEKLGQFEVPEMVDYKYLLKTNPISCLTRFIKKNAVGNILMPNIKIRQEYVFCLELIKKTNFAYGQNQCLAARRLKKNSLSYNKFRTAYYQFLVFYNFEKIGFFLSIYYLLRWFFNGIRKHKKLLKFYI